jgi:hypothetical protein
MNWTLKSRSSAFWGVLCCSFYLCVSSRFLLRLQFTGLFQHKGLRFGNGHGLHYAFPGTGHSGFLCSCGAFMGWMLGCSYGCKVAYVLFSGMDGVFALINVHCLVYVVEGVVMLMLRVLVERLGD